MTKKIDNTEAVTTTDTTTTEPKETTTMKLKDVIAREFSPEQIDEMASIDIKKLIIEDFGINILSEVRAQPFLVKLVRTERIKTISPQYMLALTGRNCWVKGTSITVEAPDGTITKIGGAAKDEADAKYNPTPEEYEAYTADERANIVNECCSKNRSDRFVLNIIGNPKFTLTHVELMYLTNNRVTITGLETTKTSPVSNVASPESLESGISFE